MKFILRVTTHNLCKTKHVKFRWPPRLCSLLYVNIWFKMVSSKRYYTKPTNQFILVLSTVYTYIYLHSLLIFCRKKLAFNLCIARRSGTASRAWHLLSINPLTGSCLAKFRRARVCIYCSIVYSLFLMGHEKHLYSNY